MVMRVLNILINVRMGRLPGKLFGLLAGLVLLLGCMEQPAPATPTPAPPQPVETAVVSNASPAPTRVLPTLFPTPTSFPSPVPTEMLPTSTPRPTATPIDFTQLAVEVHYTIPALELSRTIRGNISSHIELTDEMTGESVVVTDLPGVLFDLQRTLPEADLSAVPEGCDACVQFSYELFLVEEAGEGWLTDPVLLASFENFFSAHLGPHFPPGTVAGLRRSATPYYVAHSVALTADGDLWRWTATESEVSPVETGFGAIVALGDGIILDDVEPAYLGPCPDGSGVESLYLKQGEMERLVDLACPELSLSLPLVPVYAALSALATETIADEALPQPSPTVPLESVVYYQRNDGAVLILFADDRAQAIAEDGSTNFATLVDNQAIDTALTLTESGFLEMGVIKLVSGGNSNILIGRGIDGVYETGWNEAPPEELQGFMVELDNLLDDLLADVTPSETETPTPEPEETPEATATP